jgi:two-component system KDP operon response regulator KdpE
VQKPFDVGEFLARLRAAMRNKAARMGASSVVTAGEIMIDLTRRLVTKAGEPVRLSPREYKLLSLLVEAAGRIVTHQQLLTAVWGPNNTDNTHYLRIFIQHLRQKLEADPSAPRHILTEAGVGYRFMA